MNRYPPLPIEVPPSPEPPTPPDYLTEPGSRPCNCNSADAPYSLCQLTEKIIDDAGMALVTKEELAGLRADRERYRFVRDNAFVGPKYIGVDLIFGARHSTLPKSEQFDEAIDAARGAK